jgi:hypothetical protein
MSEADPRSGANFWSSSRYNANNAWYFNGNTGYANNNNLNNGYRALPVLNYSQQYGL